MTRGATIYWIEIGIKLFEDEDMDTLRNIDFAFPDKEKCCEQMFTFWLKRNESATWDQLLQALKGVGLNALASTVKDGMYIFTKVNSNIYIKMAYGN